ncbi:NUDIX domain-containing protein [Clostridium sp.]|uniref:NUDIX domain-containing protein n=1 Tax=Clostridium sp. TaxID=1506 RepID=UPI003216DA67
MEYFDILNRDGSKSGKIAPKDEELLEGQYDLGVHAYIHNSKGEFLIQKRAKTKQFLPGGGDIHMGHVMAGETSKEAIIREVDEELGIKIDNIAFIKRVLWEKYNHFIDIFVLCKDINISDLTIQKSELDDVKFISAEEMINLIKSMDYKPEEYRTFMNDYINEIILNFK